MSDCILHKDLPFWQQLRQGNAEALGYLYSTYLDRLYGAALKMTDNHELVEDAIQEIFLELWCYRKTIGDVNNSYGYLVKVLKSIILKKVKKKIVVNEITESSNYVHEDLNIEEELVSADQKREQKRKLSRALTCLTNRQKEVVQLRYYEGLTYEQIAEKLSMNYQSVNNLAFRAMLNLRKQM